MTLLFGDLTQAFVNFGLALQETPEDLGPAADHSRTVAARTAGWLAVLGLGLGIAVAIYLSTWTYTGGTYFRRREFRIEHLGCQTHPRARIDASCSEFLSFLLTSLQKLSQSGYESVI